MAPLTASTDCEAFQRDTENDVEKEEVLSPNSPCDILGEERPKLSPLEIPFYGLPERTSSIPSSSPACQSASTRQEDDSRFQTNKIKSSFSEDVPIEAAKEVHEGGEKEPQVSHEAASKADETSSQNVRLPSEEEKIRERSRKGRERSLRTRRRNTARLKLLEANCSHFSKENKVLRELARSLSDEDTESAIESFKQYKLLEREKPEPHTLSQPESHYTQLFSPLSVTASTVAAETDSVALNGAEGLFGAEHSLVPCTYKGLLKGSSSDNPKTSHVQHQVSMHTTLGSLQVESDVTTKNVESPPVFRSVFADPDYREDGDFGISIEELYRQPPLPIEEIFQLFQEGRNLPELPQL